MPPCSRSVRGHKLLISKKSRSDVQYHNHPQQLCRICCVEIVCQICPKIICHVKVFLNSLYSLTDFLVVNRCPNFPKNTEGRCSIVSIKLAIMLTRFFTGSYKEKEQKATCEEGTKTRNYQGIQSRCSWFVIYNTRKYPRPRGGNNTTACTHLRIYSM